jgi:hypothetical protein
MAESTFTFSCPGCCGDGAGWEVQCRSRTGIATLCGFREFGTPSNPPKRYKLATLSGSTSSQTTYAGGSTWTSEASGSLSINPAVSCDAVQGEVSHHVTVTNDQPPIDSSDTHQFTEPCAYGVHHAFGPGLSPVSITKTRKACRLNGDSQSGEIAANLSSEDTESMAMSRVVASWSEWGAGSCCSLTSGYGGVFLNEFGFSQSEYRIRVKGGPGQLITLYVWFTETGVTGEFSEVRQFTAEGPEFGEWQSFPIQNSPGTTRCLTRIARYVA